MHFVTDTSNVSVHQNIHTSRFATIIGQLILCEANTFLQQTLHIQKAKGQKHKTEEWKCYFNLIFTFITTTSQVAENKEKNENKKQTDWNSHTHSSLVMILGLHG